MDFLEYVCQVFALDVFEQYCVQGSLQRELSSTVVWTAGQAAAEYSECLTAEQICEYFHPNSKLMRYFFIWDNQPVFARRLSLRMRMMDFLTGHVLKEDDTYGRKLTLVQPEELADGQPNVMETLLQLTIYQKANTPCLIGLYGREGAGRRHHVRRLYYLLQAPLILLDCSIFTGNMEQDCRIADDILAECVFYQSGLMLCGLENIRLEKAVFQRLFDVLPIIFVSASRQQLYFKTTDGFVSYWVEVGHLSYEEALHIWMRAAQPYTLAPDILLEEMPNKFTLTPGQIYQVVGLAAQISLVHGREVISSVDLREACHQLLAENMGKKVQRIAPAYQWDELVLPDYQKQMLSVACSQVRYKNRVYAQWGFEQKIPYGRGISMIFSGLPGTGKTMAAQVIASELNMDLYKVELAAVVSKYIGETEKNLEEIFEQAKTSQVILFFDEADVLFSKRTEVKSSNDKYSNLEAAYMLQKIESYEGIVILSTNYLQNFDEAFKRRMKMIIDFPFPNPVNRLKIWKQVFPQKLPLDREIDFEYLARQFEFSGSNIKNAALYGSFLAAAENRAVTMSDLIEGIKVET